MHREIRSIERPLAMESSLPVYSITLLTALLVGLESRNDLVLDQ